MALCDLCDFETDSKTKLDTHELFEHNFPCPDCLNIFRTAHKLEKHICKLEVENPTYDSFYSRDWMNGNGCNSINSTKLCQEVGILHSEKCVLKISARADGGPRSPSAHA